jgi:hypothetical protein
LLQLLKRQIEPELMLEPEQVLAYAKADFSGPHDAIIESFKLALLYRSFLEDAAKLHRLFKLRMIQTVVHV